MWRCHVSTVNKELTAETNCMDENFVRDQKFMEYFQKTKIKVCIFKETIYLFNPRK